jgi:hypothetical protein
MKKSKLVLGSIVAGAVTGAAAMYKATVDFTKNMLYRNEIERTNVDDLDVDIIRLKNSRGLVLYGYLRKHDNAQRTLVMCHRLGENAGSLKTAAQAFEKLLPETNILLLDSRCYPLIHRLQKVLCFFPRSYLKRSVLLFYPQKYCV